MLPSWRMCSSILTICLLFSKSDLGISPLQMRPLKHKETLVWGVQKKETGFWDVTYIRNGRMYLVSYTSGLPPCEERPDALEITLLFWTQTYQKIRFFGKTFFLRSDAHQFMKCLGISSSAKTVFSHLRHRPERFETFCVGAEIISGPLTHYKKVNKLPSTFMRSHIE